MHEIRQQMRPLQERLDSLQREFEQLVPEDGIALGGAPSSSPTIGVAATSQVALASPANHQLDDDFNEEEEQEQDAAALGTTMSDRVLEILNARRGSNLDAESIARAMGGTVNLPSLRSTLQRLESHGKIRRAARGLYGAVKGQIGATA